MLRAVLRSLVLALVFSAGLLALTYYALPRFGLVVDVRPIDRSIFLYRMEPTLEARLEGAPSIPMSQPTPTTANEVPRVRNLVVLLADGLGFSHLLAARTALVGARGRLWVERLPITSWHTTFAPEGTYTDSAAGASALAAGVWTTPGYLSMDPDGNPVPTLMEEALAAGKSAALITDSYIWDASMAVWLVHHPKRRDFEEVAAQMAASGVTMAFGEARSDGDEALTARLQPFRDAGFDVVTEPQELERLSYGHRSQIAALPPHSIAAQDTFPNLVDLVDMALLRLMADPDGFLLFVETEEVDSGGHNYDFDRVIRGIEALDKAAQRIVETVRDRNDTLILFTGDHETGGLALGNSRLEEPLSPMWAWDYHTPAPVPLLAWGAGAERLAGVHDNFQVGRILRELFAKPENRTGDALRDELADVEFSAGASKHPEDG